MYLHSEYAGNLADCHKHQWLCYLLTNDPPASYLETHAGAGCYTLSPSGRWHQGLGRLWPTLCNTTSENNRWLEALHQLNPAGLHHYPGSPWLARQCLGADALVLFELDIEVSDQLRQNLPDADVRTGDGFSSVTHLLESDCLLMVDPPYSELYDFERALMLMNLVLQRQDCKLMLWYPRFNDQREQPWLEQIEDLMQNTGGIPAWRSELTFEQPQGSLLGSGIAVLGVPTPEEAQREGLTAQFKAAGASLRQIDY